MWQAVVAPPAVWQDSESYHAVARHALLSTGMWTGSRPPVVPLLLKVVSFPSYIVLQAAVGCVAWGLAAWMVSRLVRPGWQRVAATWAVLGFASATLVVQWDWSVLSESLSLSVLALLCASGLWLVRRFTIPRLFAFALCAIAFVGLRDEDIWTVALAGVGVLAVATVGMLRGVALESSNLRRSFSDRWHAYRHWVLTGVTLIAVAAAAELAANASHRNVLNVEHALEVRIFPFPSRTAWFGSHGMPDAGDVIALSHSAPPGGPGAGTVVAPDLNDPKWVALRTWFDTHGEKTYVQWLITHPGYDVTAPFATPPLTFNNAMGDLTFYLPAGHQDLALLDTIFVPNHVVVIFLAAAVLLLVSARRRWRPSEWQFLSAFTAIGLVSMLLAWHGDGEEVTRHMVEGNVEVRLGVLVLLLVAVLGPGAARRTEHDHDAQPVPAASSVAKDVAIVDVAVVDGTAVDGTAVESTAVESTVDVPMEAVHSSGPAPPPVHASAETPLWRTAPDAPPPARGPEASRQEHH
jgi:hypothetical protein